MGKVHGWGRWLLGPALVFLALCGTAQALPTTRIQDILFNADGSKAAGTVTIQWRGFTASDGSTVTSNSIAVRIVEGVLVVELTPNETATPAGTSYTATYLLDNGTRFSETWIVPESPTAVTISQVRVSTPTVPGTVIAQSQVAGLIAALAEKADVGGENVFSAPQTVQENGLGPTDPLLALQQEGGPESVGVRIPALSASSLYTLPGSDGLPGQQLTTDGTGNLFWSASGSGQGQGLAYEVFQDAGTPVTQRNVANFANGLTVFDNGGQTRTEVQPVYGTTAGTVTQGNDSRLSDARNPLAHASSHASGGSDPITPISIGALKNTNDVITSTDPVAAGLSVRGAFGQSASIQDWRDNAGTVLALVSPEGSMFVREMGVSAKLGGTVASQFFIVDGLNRFALSGFQGVLDFSRYDDQGVFKDHAIQIFRSGDTFVNTSLVVSDIKPTTGATKLTVKAGQGQGTTALQEWKDNAGAVRSSVDNDGNLSLQGTYMQLAESSAPATPGAAQARLFLDAASGELMVRKSSGSSISLEGSGGGSVPVFHDAETPAGAVDGVNDTFTLLEAPAPAASLQLVRNGVMQKPGVDFTLVSNSITFVSGAIPQPGDELLSWYRSSP